MICHGPIALLATKKAFPDKPFLYSGYNIAVYSNAEEKINETLWKDETPFKAQTALEEAGCIVQDSYPLMSKVVEDRELVTGQNPSSVGALATRQVIVCIMCIYEMYMVRLTRTPLF